MPDIYQLLVEADYLRRILLENRLEFLRNRYVPLLYDYITTLDHREWDELCSAALRDTEDMHELVFDPMKAAPYVFDWIASLDPDTSKRYTQWLLNIFMRKGFRPEDGYKAKQYLTTFEQVKGQLPVEQRDINRYRTLNALYDVIWPVEAARSKRQIDREQDEAMHGEAMVMLNTPHYKIVIPLTQAASCHFGVNTQWCTAAEESENMFDRYHEDGDLYIILDKQNNRRWQFQFESDSFMDEHDHAIDVDTFAAKHPEIAKFFYDMDEKNKIDDIGSLLVIKTRRGFVIKERPGLDGHAKTWFIVENGKITRYNIEYEWFPDTGKALEGLGAVFNKQGIVGDEEGDDLAGLPLFYRKGQWGTQAQVGDPVVRVGIREWKAIESPKRGNASGLTRFMLVLDTHNSDEKAYNHHGHTFWTSFAGDGNSPWGQERTYSLKVMPLIKARPDIQYWTMEFSPNFNDLLEADKKWILHNRPTLCSPSYAYEHGLPDVAKDVVMKLMTAHAIGNRFDYTHTGGYRYGAAHWIGNKLLAYEWHDLERVEHTMEEVLHKRKPIKDLPFLHFSNRHSEVWLPVAEYGRKRGPQSFNIREDSKFAILIPIEMVVRMFDSFNEIHDMTWPRVVWRTHWTPPKPLTPR